MAPDEPDDKQAPNSEPAPEKASQQTTALLTVSAVLIGAAALFLASVFAFGLLPKAFHAPTFGRPWSWGLGISGVMLGLAGLAILLRQVDELVQAASAIKDQAAQSAKLYGIHLVGIGFALLFLALSCSVVLVGIAWSHGAYCKNVGSDACKVADSTDSQANGLTRIFGSSQDAAFQLAGLFVLSTMFALLGALFFFATALWQKMDTPTREPFDNQMFWAGLWFRLGEAVLFNLVFFLVLRVYRTDGLLMLPLVSLLVGMFLKAGETLVSGIASRVFAAMLALMPSDGKKEMKLLTFKIVAPPPGPGLSAKIDELKTTLKALAGVNEVDTDVAGQTARVEYDASTATDADIKRKAELKGLQIEITRVS